MNFSPRYMICKHLFTTLVLEKHPIITTVQIEIPLKLRYKNVTKNLSKLQHYVIIKGCDILSTTILSTSVTNYTYINEQIGYLECALNFHP
jgi:hypothetical protein